MCTQAVTVFVVSVLSFCDFARVEGQTTTGFSFPTFQSDDGSMVMSPEAQYNSTYNSYDLNTQFLERCAKIVYKDRVRMLNRASGKVASFSTSFTFSFLTKYHSRYTCGEGLVFTITATSSLTLEEKSSQMCAFDYEELSGKRVFAVKFDSYLNNLTKIGYNDPSDGTIGVVVNNIGNTTIQQYNLCSSLVYRCKYFCDNKGDYTAWIDYDGATKMLEVRFRTGSLSSGAKPATPLLSVFDLGLERVFDEEMYVGFNARTLWLDWDRATHRLTSWNFDSSGVAQGGSGQVPPVQKTKSSQVGVIAGASAAAAVVGTLLVGVVLFFVFKYKEKRFSEQLEHKTSSLHDTSRAFTFKELSTMTKNFNESELLASGAFGDVFKGTPPEGSLVAVKRIKHTKVRGEESFLAEVNSLKQIRHRNLLQLRGWCEAKEGLFLVCDFMSNGSLDKWIHRDPNQVAMFAALSWNVRRHILAGIAAGLAYLHEEWVQCVLHRDIKSSNVMLDADFNAYLGDFGLGCLVDRQKLQKTTLMAGTLGYMAPELQYTGRATKETDVYGFGILILEVVCGRRPLEIEGSIPGEHILLDRVWRAHEAGDISTMIDQRLYHSDAFQWLGMIASTLQLGLLCCLPNPADRLPIGLANQWFQSSVKGVVMALPLLPASQPRVPAGQYNSMPPLKAQGPRHRCRLEVVGTKPRIMPTKETTREIMHSSLSLSEP